MPIHSVNNLKKKTNKTRKLSKREQKYYSLRAEEQLKERLKAGGIPEKAAENIARGVIQEETKRIAEANTAQTAHGKNSLFGKNGRAPNLAAFEHKAPNEASEMVLGLADPWSVIKDVAAASGVHPAMAHSLAERIRTRYLPVLEKTKEYTNQYYISRIEERMDKALDYMDDFAFAGASLRDIAITFQVLGEHRRLLNDEPTQILGVQERNDLNELIPKIYAEAKRRGITIDATVEGQTRAVPGDTRKLLDGAYRRAESGMKSSVRKTRKLLAKKKDANG